MFKDGKNDEETHGKILIVSRFLVTRKPLCALRNINEIRFVPAERRKPRLDWVVCRVAPRKNGSAVARDPKDSYHRNYCISLNYCVSPPLYSSFYVISDSG